MLCRGTSHCTKITGPELTISTWTAPLVEREFSVIGGLTLGPRKLGVNNKDIRTLEASIMERVLHYRKGNVILEPLTPVLGAFTVCQKFKHKLIKIYGDKPTTLNPSELVALYNGRKRTIYQSASEEFMAKGVLPKHARIRAFVKAEKVDINKAPRCIQPRSPVYNVGLGVYLKHIEHPLYLAIARAFKQPFVVSKGLNVVELGRKVSELWNGVDDPVFIGLDASRFDMHVSQDALRYEHSIYKELYNYDPTLKRLLEMQLVNSGSGWCPDGKLKYKTRGCRMSGDMNTGLGNCLLMCSMFYAYMDKVGLKGKFINNGDDCGVILTRRDLHKMEGVDTWFNALGFRMEVEPPVYELERLVFCQMQPIRTPRGYVMVRQLHTAIEKDSMSIVPLRTRKMLRKWMYSVGECGLALTSGVPILQAFYSFYMREGLPSNISEATYMECGARHLAKGLQAKSLCVTNETRWSFYLAFGVIPEDQRYLEQRYESMVLGHGVSVHDTEAVPGLLVTRVDQ